MSDEMKKKPSGSRPQMGMKLVYGSPAYFAERAKRAPYPDNYKRDGDGSEKEKPDAVKPAQPETDEIPETVMAAVYGGPQQFPPDCGRADLNMSGILGAPDMGNGKRKGSEKKARETIAMAVYAGPQPYNPQMMMVYAGPAPFNDRMAQIVTDADKTGDPCTQMKDYYKNQADQIRMENEKWKQGICPGCNEKLPIGENVRFCSNCGKRVVRFCPTCGERLFGKQDLCPNCDKKSDSGCPTCGAKNRTDGKFCVECGTSLMTACASCGKQIGIAWKRCPECGAEQ